LALQPQAALQFGGYRACSCSSLCTRHGGNPAPWTLLHQTGLTTFVACNMGTQAAALMRCLSQQLHREGETHMVGLMKFN
jgi:hypothetical protein